MPPLNNLRSLQTGNMTTCSLPGVQTTSVHPGGSFNHSWKLKNNNTWFRKWWKVSKQHLHGWQDRRPPSTSLPRAPHCLCWFAFFLCMLVPEVPQVGHTQTHTLSTSESWCSLPAVERGHTATQLRMQQPANAVYSHFSIRTNINGIFTVYFLHMSPTISLSIFPPWFSHVLDTLKRLILPFHWTENCLRNRLNENKVSGWMLIGLIVYIDRLHCC